MKHRICIFGEVLFDHFPDGEQILGGAPFNVAWHLQAFGQAPHFISRIGNDIEGDTVRTAMHNWGMNIEGLQLDEQHPTGRVNIQIIDNEPVYDIVQPVAYDAIETVPAKDDAGCELLYHGSLALRGSVSKHTVENLIANRPGLIFIDVNLRAPWYQREHVKQMARNADWIKLNVNEMKVLYPTNKNQADQVADILKENQLDGLILTRGPDGASVVTATGEHLEVIPEADVELVDTVGAGDAFASVMILGLKNHWPLDVTLMRAQEFASAMVGQRGATVNDPRFYKRFIESWKLES